MIRGGAEAHAATSVHGGGRRQGLVVRDSQRERGANADLRQVSAARRLRAHRPAVLGAFGERPGNLLRASGGLAQAGPRLLGGGGKSRRRRGAPGGGPRWHRAPGGGWACRAPRWGGVWRAE